MSNYGVVNPVRQRKISGIALFFIAVLALFWLALGMPLLVSSCRNDFLCYYIGGTLAREGRFAELYRPAVQRQVQDAIAPGLQDPRPFVRPPWFALAVAPLTALPLEKAYAVWTAAWLAALLAIWVWGARRFGEAALMVAALFFPATVGIAYGQDCTGMLAVCCGGWMLLERRRTFAGGLVLGLGLMKLHLLALLPVWFILQRRWRMLAGFITTGGAFLAAALASVGTSGLRAYLHLLRYGQTELFGHSPDSMIDAYSVLVNSGVDSAIVRTALAVVVVGAAAGGLFRAPTWRALAIALTGSLLITPHAFAYDAAMLLLPVWLVLENSKRRLSRWGALALANPLTFYFTAAHPPLRCIPAVALLVFLGIMVTDRTRGEQPGEAGDYPSLGTAAIASISTATSRGSFAA